MASFASITVFSDDSTRTGIGKYCSAVSEAMVAVGGVMCIDMGSLRMESGDSDLDRSPSGKYPASELCCSVIMITLMLCDRCVVEMSNRCAVQEPVLEGKY